MLHDTAPSGVTVTEMVRLASVRVFYPSHLRHNKSAISTSKSILLDKASVPVGRLLLM